MYHMSDFQIIIQVISTIISIYSTYFFNFLIMYTFLRLIRSL